MPKPHPRMPAITAVVAMMIFACLAWRTAPGNNIPERLALENAEPWMADALPGVGIKSREHVAELLRTQQLEKIPARAQVMVPQLFKPPQHK